MNNDSGHESMHRFLFSMNARPFVAVITIGLLLWPVAHATAADVAGFFSQGRTTLSVVVGSGSAFDESYFVFGIGGSYFVIDGLNFGLNVQWWSGADPNIVKVSPSIEYVFYQVQPVAPYIGALYRRSYIENLSDLDSAGGRAGIFIPAGRNVNIGVGAAYEVYFDCHTSTYSSCTDTYPEVSVLIGF
jgi:hypothetical protein